mmetsp:Transcript_59385/g.165826  ORF Transcript_59385/g.165826 Transcript_59385/m.165826 type:complete len:201 (+) Transcript_59385:667-1269(+)
MPLGVVPDCKLGAEKEPPPWPLGAAGLSPSNGPLDTGFGGCTGVPASSLLGAWGPVSSRRMMPRPAPSVAAVCGVTADDGETPRDAWPPSVAVVCGVTADNGVTPRGLSATLGCDNVGSMTRLSFVEGRSNGRARGTAVSAEASSFLTPGTSSLEVGLGWARAGPPGSSRRPPSPKRACCPPASSRRPPSAMPLETVRAC